MTRAALLLALACLAPGAASAQIVYRCGAEYSSEPCGGNARRVDVGDPVTPERHALALEEARHQQQLAASMARERHAEEAAYRKALAAATRPAQGRHVAKADDDAKKPQSKTKRGSIPSADGDFIARVPKLPKTKTS